MFSIVLLANPKTRGQILSLVNSITSYLAFRPLIYGYANARVHGMYSNLLSSSQMEELVGAHSVSTLAEMLERTAYKKDLVELSLKSKGEELIEIALSKNFARFSNQLLLLTPNQTRPVFDALMSRWDAHNLKMVILARKQGKTYGQIEPYLVLAGNLTKNNLKNLLAAESSESFYSILRLTQFGAGLLSMPSSSANGPIRQMILSIGKDNAALEPLLALLDIYSYKSIADVAAMPHREAKEVAPLLERYADEKNLSTVLRMIKSGASEQKTISYLVPGGKVSLAQWKVAIALNDISKIMVKLSHRLPLEAASKKFERTKKISDLEVALSHDSAKKGLMQFRHSQLSLGVIVGALLIKEQEVSNIRKIVRSKALGLPESEIRAMMVLVK